MEEKLSFEKLLKSEVECELAKSRANLAEVTKANKALQQELNKDKSLMHETANKLGDREDNAKQKHDVNEELKSESNSFTVVENFERSERPNKEKDSEINSFRIEVPAEKIHVGEVTTLGAVAVGMDANLRKEDDGEVELVDFIDNVNLLESGGYVPKESVKDVAIGDNLSLMQITAIT